LEYDKNVICESPSDDRGNRNSKKYSQTPPSLVC
jgi:hypothetical protein